MTDNDLQLAKLQRSARSVSRLSTAVKVICVRSPTNRVDKAESSH